MYPKSSINPPWGASFFQALLRRGRGGLFERGAYLILRNASMGARFLQDGLVVPGCYTAFSNNKQMVTILRREIDSVKLEKLST